MNFRKIVMSVASAAMALVALPAVAASTCGDYGLERIQAGFRINPVPLTLGDRSSRVVGYGSYLVNAIGGCSDCHTNPPYKEGGDPFLGQPKKVNAAAYLGGGVSFGPFTSANITPDRYGRPAGLSLREFIKLMRTGKEPGEDEILQVMPWPVYQSMTDCDLTAIYNYLQSIPRVRRAS